MEKERIWYWDNLKAVLIFLVVFGHFLISIKGKGESIQSVYYFVYFFHMPAFVFVSGYFAKYYMKKNVPDISKLLGFLILFFVYKGLIWGVDSLLEGKIAQFQPLTESSAPWYLLGMFVWYIYLPMFAKLKSKAGIAAAVILGLIIGFDAHVGAFLCISRCIVFLPFFLAGYYFRGDIIKKITTTRVRIFAVVLLAVCMIAIILNLPLISRYESIIYGNSSYMALQSVISEGKALLLRAVWYLIAFGMMFAVMSLIPKRKLPISYIGGRTLSIYIVHRLIRQVVEHYKIYNFFDYNGITLLIFCVAISVVITFALSGKYLYKLFQSVFKIKYDKLMIMK